MSKAKLIVSQNEQGSWTRSSPKSFFAVNFPLQFKKHFDAARFHV